MSLYGRMTDSVNLLNCFDIVDIPGTFTNGGICLIKEGNCPTKAHKTQFEKELQEHWQKKRLNRLKKKLLLCN